VVGDENEGDWVGSSDDGDALGLELGIVVDGDNVGVVVGSSDVGNALGL
jgi:hypothetical protein